MVRIDRPQPDAGGSVATITAARAKCQPDTIHTVVGVAAPNFVCLIGPTGRAVAVFGSFIVRGQVWDIGYNYLLSATATVSSGIATVSALIREAH